MKGTLTVVPVLLLQWRPRLGGFSQRSTVELGKRIDVKAAGWRALGRVLGGFCGAGRGSTARVAEEPVFFVVGVPGEDGVVEAGGKHAHGVGRGACDGVDAAGAVAAGALGFGASEVRAEEHELAGRLRGGGAVAEGEGWRAEPGCGRERRPTELSRVDAGLAAGLQGAGRPRLAARASFAG